MHINVIKRYVSIEINFNSFRNIQWRIPLMQRSLMEEKQYLVMFSRPLHQSTSECVSELQIEYKLLPLVNLGILQCSCWRLSHCLVSFFTVWVYAWVACPVEPACHYMNWSRVECLHYEELGAILLHDGLWNFPFELNFSRWEVTRHFTIK